MKSQKTRFLVLAALFAALDIVSTRFLSFYAPTVPPGLVRIGPQIVVEALCGWLLGPVWGAGMAVAADLLGFVMFPPPFPFHPGYTLSAGLVGLIFGLMLYKKPVHILRVLAAQGLVTLIVSLGLNSVWGYMILKAGVFANVLTALPWRLGLLPVYAATVFLLQKALKKPRDKFFGG